jgi:ADP-ribose pyrophosphatase YjhB (NUDIX family)
VKIYVRVAGIALNRGQVLLHRGEMDDFWSLPGGQVEWMETAQTALMREMREEIATDVRVGRLLYVVENFFVYRDMRYHEIGLYFQMDLPSESLFRHSGGEGTEAFFALEPHPFKLIFEWVSPERVLKPDFLTAELPLVETLTSTRHLVNDEAHISR